MRPCRLVNIVVNRYNYDLWLPTVEIFTVSKQHKFMSRIQNSKHSSNLQLHSPETFVHPRVQTSSSFFPGKKPHIYSAIA